MVLVRWPNGFTLATSRRAESKTFVLIWPRAFVVAMGSPSKSYVKVVRLPSSSICASTRFRGV
jgi:hypothetical protein